MEFLSCYIVTVVLLYICLCVCVISWVKKEWKKLWYQDYDDGIIWFYQIFWQMEYNKTNCCTAIQDTLVQRLFVD